MIAGQSTDDDIVDGEDARPGMACVSSSLFPFDPMPWKQKEQCARHKMGTRCDAVRQKLQAKQLVKQACEEFPKMDSSTSARGALGKATGGLGGTTSTRRRDVVCDCRRSCCRSGVFGNWSQGPSCKVGNAQQNIGSELLF